MASINTTCFNLRALIESKKAGKLSPRKVCVPKYCMVLVNRLKNEWAVICIDPQSIRNSVKGIQHGIEQHNRFSKELRLSPKGKMNSPGDGFVPLREKVVERATSPWGRLTTQRENDAGRFRECSSRKRAFSLRGKTLFTLLNDKVVGKVTVPRKKANKLVFSRERADDIFPRGGYGDRVVPKRKRRFQPEDKFTPPKGRFFSLREKIADNFTSPREKIWERHIPLIRPIFPRDGPSSLRYRMMSHKDKFTSPKDMVENKLVFFQGKGCRDGKACEVYHSS